MKHKLTGILVAPVLAILMAGPAHSASQFVHQLVERPDTLGQVTSLALNPQGEPRVAYWEPQRQALRFALKSGGIWVRESAESTDVLGLHTSLALDASARRSAAVPARPVG